MPTPSQVILINNISGYLAANAVANGQLFAPYTDSRLPLMLYMEGAALIWGNKYGASNLQGTANYVYALDGKFGAKAQAIIAQGGGGSVAPITPPTLNVSPIEFTVSDISQIPTDGNTLSIPSFIGFNLIFSRSNIIQGQLNVGGTYFTWNKVTGIFMMFGNAVEGEDLLLQATI